MIFTGRIAKTIVPYKLSKKKVKHFNANLISKRYNEAILRYIIIHNY